MDAVEQKQCLAISIAGRDPADSEEFLLVTEAALQDSCAQVADDQAGCRDICGFVLVFRPFADEAPL